MTRSIFYAPDISFRVQRIANIRIVTNVMFQSRTDDQIRARLTRFIEHVVRVGFATRPARRVTGFEYMRTVVLDNRYLAQHNEEKLILLFVPMSG